MHNAQQKGEPINHADIAASFQEAIVDVLTKVTMEAAKMRGMKKIALAGGVAANGCLRRTLEAAAQKEGIKLYTPPLSLCTDNGAMIACAGYYGFRAGERGALSQNAFPSL